MAGGMSKSRNSTSSVNETGGEFGQEVFRPQGEALKRLYGDVGGIFGGMQADLGNQGQYGGQFAQGVMEGQLPNLNDQYGGGVYKDLGIGNQLMDSLNQSNNSPTAMQDINSLIMGGNGNNYLDALKNTMQEDANLGVQNSLAALDARAAASGMSGGARQGVAQGKIFEDSDRTLQRNFSDLGFGAYDKDLERKLGIARDADANTLSRQQLMSGMLNNQQGTVNQAFGTAGNLVNQGKGQQLMPWEIAGQYAGALGAPTVLGSGKNYGRGSSKGSGMGMGISGSGG